MTEDPHEFHQFASNMPDDCAECIHKKGHAIHGADPLAEAVAQAEAQLNREVWMAVRISDGGGVAFLGAFDTLDNAQKRCEHHKDAAPFWWRARSDHPDVHEWETDWFPFVGEVRVKFVVALREVQDNPLPQTAQIKDR